MSARQRVVSLVKLPLAPFRPLGFMFGHVPRTADRVRHVLYGFCALGVAFSFFAGVFLAGLVSRGVPGARALLQGPESWVLAYVAVATLPFLGLAALPAVAGRTVLRHAPPGPLGAIPGLERPDRFLRAYLVVVGVSFVLVALNLTALALILLGAMAAAVVSLTLLAIMLMLIMVTLGAILKGGGWSVWETLGTVWDYATLPRYLFVLEGHLAGYLDTDGPWLMIAAILYIYAVPAMLAVWLLTRRGAMRAAVAGGR